MAKKTGIQWTDVTDNVFVVEDPKIRGKQAGWFCVRHSPGCDHCYAEHLNVNRQFGGNGLAYKIPMSGELPPFLMKVGLMSGWARQKKRKMHFINSMTDTFAKFYPIDWMYYLLDSMVAAPLQIFQVLTKRADVMCNVVNAWLEHRGLDEVPHHIRLGVSVENQLYADRRIHHLLAIKCQRFLSVEPMLGPVDLTPYLETKFVEGPELEWPKGTIVPEGTPKRRAARLSPNLHWVILGGESGDKARPMHPDWTRSVRDQCVEAGVPFFFKQWGTWLPANLDCSPGITPELAKTCEILERPDGVWFKVGKKAAGRILDGREWNEDPDGLSGNLADADSQIA